MSTLVVVKKSGRACIAADSQTTHGDMKQAGEYEETQQKIFTYGDSYIGTVGSVTNEYALRGALSRQHYDLSSKQAIFDSFCTLHKTLKEEYYLNPNEQDDDPYESLRMDALIVNPNGIFGIYALREVFEYSRFWAIGTGRDFALGALWQAYNDKDKPAEIAQCGVEAGIEFDVASGAPVIINECQLR